MVTGLNDNSPPQEQVLPNPEMAARRRRVLVGGAVGNLIEYYDLAVYGLLSVTLAPLFFPSNQPGTSILSTLAVFAVAFVMRPVGGWFYGRLGDRRGRRRALVASVVSMGVASGAVGMLPTHDVAGAFAPILLVLARLIQGFASGGGLAGSTTYVAESTPQRKRGFFVSVSVLTVAGGYSVAAVVVGVATASMTSAQMASWGWRIPFLVSLLLALFGLWARLRLRETGEFETMAQRREVERSPLLKAWQEHRGTLVRLFCIYIGNCAIGYIGNSYLSIYLIGTRGFSKNTVYWIGAVVFAAACGVYPFAGMLVDRFTRKSVLIASYGIFVILSWPMFIVLSVTTSWLVAGLMLFVWVALYANCSVSTYVVGTELFPRQVRFTGVAAALNLAVVVSGSTSPYVGQWLVQTTGDAKSPAFWVIATALISVIASLTLRGARSSSAAVASGALATVQQAPQSN
jgi:MHS family proline/betaine transporter-like MFS transporter